MNTITVKEMELIVDNADGKHLVKGILEAIDNNLSGKFLEKVKETSLYIITKQTDDTMIKLINRLKVDGKKLDCVDYTIISKYLESNEFIDDGKFVICFKNKKDHVKIIALKINTFADKDKTFFPVTEITNNLLLVLTEEEIIEINEEKENAIYKEILLSSCIKNNIKRDFIIENKNAINENMITRKEVAKQIYI